MKSSKNRKKIRAKVVGELLSIRRVLLKEVSSRKIASLMDGVIEHFKPIVEVQKKEETEPPATLDFSSLEDAVSSSITSKEDVYSAQGYWSVSYLLQFTSDQRLAICKALVKRSKDFGVKPKKVWINIIKDPVFYEEWAEENYGDETGSLDEVAL